jgi:Flp pilus assembly protein CpaB
MTKDRLFFLFSFIFIGIVAVLLFSRTEVPEQVETPATPQEAKATPQAQQPEKTPKQDSLAVEAGKIAVPFQITSRSSIVYFLKLGSIVDVIFTSKADIGFGTITFTLFQNIRVLDIGRDSEGRHFNEPNSFYKHNTPVEILLEMTPRQAEVLSYAEQFGNISLGIEGEYPSEGYHELVERLLKSESDENFQSILMTHMMSSLFPESKIKIIATPRGYIISGTVADQQTNEKIVQILTMLSTDKEKAIVNLMEQYAEPVEVLSAKKDLKANAFLSGDDYTWLKVDPVEVNPSLILRNSQSERWLSEFIVSRDIPRGELIKQGDVIWRDEIHKNQPQLSEMPPLQPGKIAIPVQLSTRSPILQFLSPGIYVDVRFTSRPDIGLAPVSLILLEDIRVLSIGRDAEGNVFDERSILYKPEMPIEVFLEMTPRQAEILAFAQQTGLISLEVIQFDRCDEHDCLAEMLLNSESFGEFHSTLITYMIRALFPSVCLKVTATPQGFIVEGRVPDPQMAGKIMEILTRLVPGGERAIINLMDVEPQQVLLCVKVLEVAKDVLSRVGVNWSVLYQNNNQALAFGAIFPPVSPPNYALSAAGVFGHYTLSVLLDMLQQDGYSKILAEPNLTTVSGETAHFFAGGEFPILIPQGGTLLGTVTVVFKKFGIMLDFTPIVDLNGLITLHVVPEVSNLDKQNAVVLSGFIIPSLVTRRVDTTVKLWPGQSYIIAGLYLDHLINRNDNLYGLNKIPLIGALFGSNRAEYRRSELMVVVTPYLIYDKQQACGGVNSCPQIDEAYNHSTGYSDDGRSYYYHIESQ